MLNLIKRMIIETLRASKRPELEEVANWIDNAEEEAIKTIAKFIADSFKTNGQISRVAAAKIIEFKNKNPGSGNFDEKQPTSFLEQYLDLFNYIAAVGSWRQYLLLKGFVHTDECVSLWHFDRGQANEFKIVTPISGLPCILIVNTAVQIVLLPKVSDSELLKLNEDIGEYPERPPQSLNIENGQKLIEVRDGDIEIEITYKETKTDRRGGIYEEAKTYRENREIDKKNFSGVAALVQSFPMAIKAREKSFALLTEIIKTGGKSES